MSKEFLIVFGYRLKKLRKSTGLSQEEFGKKINISGKMISRFEKGLSTMNIEQLEKIISSYGYNKIKILFTNKEKD